MINFISKYIKSDILKNISTLVTGTVIAQLIPLLVMPFLTRLYTPEDFGVLAMLTSMTMIIGSVATGRYEMALILPKKENYADNIFVIGLIFSVVISLLVLIIVIFFGDFIALKVGYIAIKPWLYLLPFTIFMLGLLNNLSLYNTRHKKFKIIATANIIRSTSMSLIQLGGAFVLKGAFGLLLGFVLSFFSGNIRLIKTILAKKDFFSNISKKKIIALFKLYRDFPKFSVWAILLNKLASELLNIILSIVFSVTTLGFYSFVNKILGIPSTFVGAAVSNVIMKEAADERNKYGNAIKTFNLVVKKMSLIFFPVFVLLFFFIEDIFGFVFGKEWIIAGTYGKIILPFIFIRFVASPLSIFFIVFEKQKLELLWQFLLFVFSMTSISIAYFYKLEIKQFLYIFSTIMSFHYILLIILSYYISRKHA